MPETLTRAQSAASIQRIANVWWLRLYCWSINTTSHRKQARSNRRRDFSATSSREWNTSVAALDGESCSSYNQSATKWGCRYMCIYISGHEKPLLTMSLRLYYGVACIAFLDKTLTYFSTFNYTSLALYPEHRIHMPAQRSSILLRTRYQTLVSVSFAHLFISTIPILYLSSSLLLQFLCYTIKTGIARYYW